MHWWRRYLRQGKPLGGKKGSEEISWATKPRSYNRQSKPPSICLAPWRQCGKTVFREQVQWVGVVKQRVISEGIDPQEGRRGNGRKAKASSLDTGSFSGKEDVHALATQYFQ